MVYFEKHDCALRWLGLGRLCFGRIRLGTSVAPSGSMILMIWKTPWQMEWQHRRISTPARNTNKTSPSCCTTWKRPGGQVIRFIRPSIFLDRTCPRIPRSRLPMVAVLRWLTGRVPITSIACTVCNEDNRDLERESLLNSPPQATDYGYIYCFAEDDEDDGSTLSSWVNWLAHFRSFHHFVAASCTKKWIVSSIRIYTTGTCRKSESAFDCWVCQLSWSRSWKQS